MSARRSVAILAVVAAAAYYVRTRQHEKFARTAERSVVPVGADSTASTDGETTATPVAQTLALNADNTYISGMLEATDSVINRWPTKTARPIRVWIASAAGTPGSLPNGERLVEQAFFEWNLANVPVRFEMSDSAHADVRVGWTERLPQSRIGVTETRGVNHYFTSGTITIATHRPNGAELTEIEVARCANHEIGHLLGLSHASDKTSIMYPELVPEMNNTRLTDKDLATVRLWYALPVGHLH